jgi:hypothetical protein
MRIVFLVVLMVAGCAGCGGSSSPQKCCTDEADCTTAGIPNGSTCSDGLLCRSHVCEEVTCSVAAQCDGTAPYCVAETCQEACSDNAQCPGFAQAANQMFCEAGACVECAGEMGCSTASPVCDMGACRKCEKSSECASAVCKSDGSCAAEADVAYVTTTGSANSNCTRAAPCTLTRALDPGIDRLFIVLAQGTYLQPSTTLVNGRRTLIGDGSTRPIVSNMGLGPVLRAGNGAEVTLENIELRGARNTVTPGFDGSGIDCPGGQNATLHLVRSAFTMNQLAGLQGRTCTFDARESTFSGNQSGINVVDSKGTIERSTIILNTGTGMFLDAGLYDVTNNFIVRNGIGVDFFPSSVGSVFQFNTLVDNMTGVRCQTIGTDMYQFPNNLIARNATNVSSSDCIFDSSMVIGNDITALKFKSPDAAPFDYHIQAGSMAVDQISTSTLMRDFDGEARPFGAGHDYGADEVH